jgi:alpha-galactosidase
MLARTSFWLALLAFLCCAISSQRERTSLTIASQPEQLDVLDKAPQSESTRKSWQYQGHAMPDLRTDTAIAVRLLSSADAEGFPREAAWETAPPIRFDTDWRGQNADAQRQTEVRLLWTPELLYLRFDARYRILTVFSDAEPNGRRDHLWDRDVCEAFLQPDPSEPRKYKEFEIAPNGFWIDLDIAPGEKHDLRSGLRRRVNVYEGEKLWRAELAVPIRSMIQRFDSSKVWRANFYRAEGDGEPRFYSAWRPTRTPQPNFHVPEAFGGLLFTAAASKIPVGR